MKTLALLSLIALAACANIPTEHVDYQPSMSYAEMMAGGVPIVDGSIYNGVTSMPEVVLKNASTTQMSTAKIEPFTALIGSQQTDKYIQTVTVLNLDTTGSVCLYLESWTQTCASSVAFTCLGATLQGLDTPPAFSRTFRITGTNKICATASEAAVDAQLERTISFAR